MAAQGCKVRSLRCLEGCCLPWYLQHLYSPCSSLWAGSCWRRSGFMRSLSAVLSLSKISLHSVFHIVTGNVLSLRVILEANCSAQHLHSLAFFSLLFPPLLNLQVLLQLFSHVHPTNDTPSVYYPHEEKNLFLLIPPTSGALESKSHSYMLTGGSKQQGHSGIKTAWAMWLSRSSFAEPSH